MTDKEIIIEMLTKANIQLEHAKCFGDQCIELTNEIELVFNEDGSLFYINNSRSDLR